ncbi:MAG: M15 family metallopeptidase [Anaerolineaceae bacterium]|nr:M15 family metallopeptidase [Anaerolineaceae bacterium]
MLGIIFKNPILSWAHQEIGQFSNQPTQTSVPLLTSTPTLSEFLTEATRVEITPTRALSAQETLDQIAADTIAYYAYELFYYPVSQDTRLPDTYPTDSAQLPLVRMGDVMVAEIIAQPLNDLMTDAKAAGFSPYLRSGFRSINDQYTAYSRYVTEAVALGMDLPNAQEHAREFSAVPGYSEHHLGLAVDLLDYFYVDWIVARNNYDKGLYQWLRQHAYEYGFVISYPPGENPQKAKAGSGYSISEPWHLRFVGYDLAEWLFNAGYIDPHSSVTVNGILENIYKTAPEQ